VAKEKKYMEKHNDLTDSTIQDWINSEKDLANLLIEIEKMSDSFKEQAEITFNKVCEIYKLPKLPQDIVDNEEYETQEEDKYEGETSVYEQLGLLKYLMPNEDLRGLVLNAIYFVKNGYVTDIEEVMLKKFGDNIPDEVGFGFRGENTDVEIVFVLQGESWFDLGCKMFTKYV